MGIIEPKRGLSPEQLQRCPLQFNPIPTFILIIIIIVVMIILIIMTMIIIMIIIMINVGEYSDCTK